MHFILHYQISLQFLVGLPYSCAIGTDKNNTKKEGEKLRPFTRKIPECIECQIKQPVRYDRRGP